MCTEILCLKLIVDSIIFFLYTKNKITKNGELNREVIFLEFPFSIIVIFHFKMSFISLFCLSYFPLSVMNFGTFPIAG